MCPACIESAAVMVAGAASTGGVLAVCIARFRRFFNVSRLWRPRSGPSLEKKASSRHTDVPNCEINAKIGNLGRCRLRSKSVRHEFESLVHSDIFAEGRCMNTTQTSRISSSIFIGRWTPKILFSLRDRPYRHGQLRRELGRVSQRMLTRTLCSLESAGLIARRVAQAKPAAVEYSLTRPGRTIIAPLRGMCRWARRYGKDVSAEVRLHESETGLKAGD
jgi:DNA-binding HxlR family transcriptional regulator